MPPPLGALCLRVVRPSVRPKPEIHSFHLYMCPLVHPINHDRYKACPSVRPSVRSSGEVSGHSPENQWMEWSEILHADPSFSPSELIMVMVCWLFKFCHYFDLVKRFNLGLSGISWRTQGGNGMKYCMLIYRDHIQSWLDYGHGLLIFLVFAPHWFSEMGNLGFLGISRRTHGRNGL